MSLNRTSPPRISASHSSVRSAFPSEADWSPWTVSRAGEAEQSSCSVIVPRLLTCAEISRRLRRKKKNDLLLRATQSKWRSVTFPQHLHIQAECVVKRTQTSVRQRDRIQRLYWRSLMCALLCVMCTCQGTQTCITRRGESGIPLTLCCLK